MLVTVGAWAQYPQGQERTGQPGQERGMRQTEQGMRHTEPGPAVKSKDVIGKTVWDNQDNKVGNLENIILCMHSGHALFGVLPGNYVGKNDQYIAVPITTFTYREDKKGCVCNVSKEQLSQAPTFNEKNWPNFTDKNYVEQVYTYYNLPNPMTRMRGQMMEGQMGPGAWAKATDLVGKNVRDMNDNKLGDLKNLVLDFNTGCALFGILPGDSVDKRDQDIAIPTTALKWNENQKYLVLNITKDQLAQAPAFNEKNWPNMTDRSFIDKVYAHFNVPSPFASAQKLGETSGEEGGAAMR